MYNIISRPIFLAGIISISSLILSTLVHFFLANKLGVKEYGIFSFSWSITVIASSIFSFGLIQTTLQYIPKYIANNQNQYIYGYIVIILKYFLIVLVPLSTLITITYLSLSDPPEILKGFQYFIFLALVLAATSIFSVITRCLDGGMLTVFFEKVNKELLMVLSIIFFTIYKLDVEYSLILKLLLLFSTLSMVITFIIMFRRACTLKIFNDKQKSYEFHDWLKSSTSFLVISLLYLLMIRIDILLIPVWWSSEEVGIYSIAIRLSEFITFGLLSIHLATLPMIARAFQSNKTSEMHKNIRLTIFLGGLSGLCVAIFLLVWGKDILRFIDSDYVPAYGVLLILLAPQVFRALDGTSGNLMTIVGLHKILLKVAIYTLFIKILLSFFLVKEFGAIGAAWSTSITLVITLVTQSWIISNHLRLPIGLTGNVLYKLKVDH